MPKNPTERQQAASRANGGKGRGPKTEAGKRISAQNGLKNAALAGTLLLPGESEPNFEELYESARAQFNPQTKLELTLVDCIAAAQWRLHRIWHLEQAALIEQSTAAPDSGTLVTPNGEWVIPARSTARAFQAVHARSGSGSVLHMAEARYGRQLTQALQQLRAIQEDKSRSASPAPKKREVEPKESQQ